MLALHACGGTKNTPAVTLNSGNSKVYKNKKTSLLTRFNWHKIILLPFVLVYAWLLIETAWVSDDAYITFRSVENFIHGYGLVHNLGERVQVFTHPFWFFVMSGFNYVTQRIGMLNAWAQMYYVNLFLSVLLSIGTVLLLVFGISRSVKGALLSIIVLTLSKSFVDYSTSGLENPLSHSLLVIFFFILLRNEETSDINFFALSFIAGFGTLNRMDLLLIFLPTLAFLIWQHSDKKRAALVIICGFLPFILWELFSIFYYGVPFPNTAYAKINTGIDKLSLVQQGVYYYQNSIRLDPITLTAFIAAVVLCIRSKTKYCSQISFGIILYLLYILYIGGDFMSGRFFAAPLITSVVILSVQDFSSNKLFFSLILIFLVLGLALPTSPARTTRSFGEEDFRVYFDENDISDERAVYYPRMGLKSSNRDKPPPGSKFSGQNWIFDETEPTEVKLVGPLGVHSYQLGPNTHVIDVNGLADPLMARLPVENPDQWRIGHFHHIIPDGYIEALSSTEILIEDKHLAEYYQRLEIVVRGDLFDRERLITIWNLNIGKYDYLIDAYLSGVD